MLIPDHLPVQLAWFAAQHGLPTFGPFHALPVPRADNPMWSMVLPCAWAALNSPVGRSILLVADTPPAFAWCLARHGNRVTILAPDFPAHVGDDLNAVTCQGVTWVASDEALATSRYNAVLALSPRAAPPPPATMKRWTGLLTIPGRMVLAFDPRRGDLHAPRGWHDLLGQTSTDLPWSPGSPIALSALERS